MPWLLVGVYKFCSVHFAAVFYLSSLPRNVIFSAVTVLISYASDSHIVLQRTSSDYLGFLILVLQASHTHDAITEAAQLMKEAVDDIMVTLNEAASEVGMVGGMVDSIAEAMTKVSIEIDPFLTLCLKAGPHCRALEELGLIQRSVMKRCHRKPEDYLILHTVK